VQEILKTVPIHRYDKSMIVDARIMRLDRTLAKNFIDAKWWQLDGVSSAVRQEEADRGWNWTREIGSIRTKPTWGAVGIMCADDFVEGVMTYRIDAKSCLEPNLGAFYIDRIASAPRNRAWLVQNPLYRGIGSAMLLWAVTESYSLGLEGRISLDSVQTPTTINFYTHKGFSQLAPPKDGLTSFELPKASAENWLIKEGLL
jgi:GNAT superfamily N-acetyltransferase